MENFDVKTIGVVGCGLMGRGIAEVAAMSGFNVILTETDAALLEKGLKAVDDSLSMAVRRNTISGPDKEVIIGRIKGTLDMNDFAGCGLVIEAATENMEIKKKIFIQLDAICPKHAILASNTSCLSIIEIAASTGRMDKVLGMHFFNPVPAMKLLELVRTIATSDETIETAKTFAQKINKSVVIAPDIPGFIVNRLLMPFFLEAIKMVESGMATREDIDRAVMLGLNHPMGPLKLADMVGLDTAYFITEAMYEETKEPRFAAPVLLRKMVTAGRYGRKAGRGFYNYG